VIVALPRQLLLSLTVTLKNENGGAQLEQTLKISLMDRIFLLFSFI
jgi:hypothetical protein